MHISRLFFSTWKNKETWIEYAYILICFHLKCCSKFFGFLFFLPRQRTCINIHILIFLIGNIFFICLGWPLFTKTVYVHKYSYSDIFYLKYCFIFFGVAFIYQDSVCAYIFTFWYFWCEILFHIFGLAFIYQDSIYA